MECIVCKGEFKSKRSTAKYCSSKCRKLAFSEPEKVSVPDLSVPCKSELAVLHPIGEHEVLLTGRTRHLFSYFGDYMTEKLKRGIATEDCICAFCQTKRIKAVRECGV